MKIIKQTNVTALLIILALMTGLNCYAQSGRKKIDLKENDYLNNLITNDEKYQISELELSGYVNTYNAKYILDMAQNGNLKKLFMENVTHFIGSGYSEQRSATYYRYNGWKRGTVLDIGDFGLNNSDFFDLSYYQWEYYTRILA